MPVTFKLYPLSITRGPVHAAVPKVVVPVNSIVAPAMTRLKSSITPPGTKRDPMVMARHVEMSVPGLYVSVRLQLLLLVICCCGCCCNCCYCCGCCCCCCWSPTLLAWRMGPRSTSKPFAVAATTAAEANVNANSFMTVCGQLSGW